MLPFWISIALLSLAQGAVVALPGVLDPGTLERLADRRWAAVPAASIVLFVLVARLAEHASAEGLTYLAYGTRDPGDMCFYPQSGRVSLRGLGIALRSPEIERLPAL